MTYKTFNVRTLLIAVASATLLASHAGAQTKVPASTDTPPAPTRFKSALEGYQAYSDDKMTSWKAANDEVARIGGWREYAKQAQQPEDTPATKAGEVKPKATP